MTSSYGLQVPSFSTVLQHDYDAAQSAQSAANLPQATTYYKLFLTDALDLLGNNFAHAGDYEHANAFFDEGLRLDPANLAMRLDYTREATAAGDLPKARQLAGEAVRKAPRDASAHLALGRVLLEMHQTLPAKEQLEAAVALDPNYVDGLALARAYLLLKDQSKAATIFEEMRKGFGDSARLHLDFGLAYAESGYPEPAIEQFKLAIAKDDRLPSAHYSLGAAYLQSMGEIDFSLAEAEFKKELQISPTDFLSNSQLGYIALTRHRFQDADKYLSKAATLDPQDPDVFLSLGQLYSETGEASKAQTALRKSISLTHDPSRNHFQVQRAHYLLARLLLQSGDAAHGKQEMQVAQQLMKKIVLQNQDKAELDTEANRPSPSLLLPRTPEPGINQQAAAEAEAYKKKIAPAIADSYNNLGVIAASTGALSNAIGYFKSAADWNPSLAGVDYNLGRAASYGAQFDLAIPPLQRYVRSHPQEQNPRIWLATSLYAVHDYGGVTQVLNAQEKLLNASPGMSAIFAESLIETGKFDEGVQRLKLLENVEPRSAEIHRAIGVAYLHRGDYPKAKVEFQTALRLNPKDLKAEFDLATVWLALKNQQQAQVLLRDLYASEAGNFDVDYALGNLLLDEGNPTAALTFLTSAEAMNPKDENVHRALANAYRQVSRLADSKREEALYLQTKAIGRSEATALPSR